MCLNFFVFGLTFWCVTFISFEDSDHFDSSQSWSMSLCFIWMRCNDHSMHSHEVIPFVITISERYIPISLLYIFSVKLVYPHQWHTWPNQITLICLQNNSFGLLELYAAWECSYCISVTILLMCSNAIIRKCSRCGNVLDWFELVSWHA